MTLIVSNLSKSTSLFGLESPIITAIGLVMVMLVIALLVERELLEIHRGKEGTRWFPVIDTFLLPVSLGLVLVFILRFLTILNIFS